MFERIYPGGSRRLRSLLVAFGLAFCFAAVARAQAPVITSVTSARQTVAIGQSLTLSVNATGATSLQWKRNGRPLTNGTTANYAITSASPPRDTGWYQVVATNVSGSTTSATIFVNVYVPTTQALGWGYVTDLSPPALTNVSAVGLSLLHGLAVQSDGTLFRWGGGMSPTHSAPPPGLSGVVAVAGSWLHSLALKSDGTVIAWGSYNVDTSAVTAGPVAGLTNVVAISDAFAHSMALRRDGTVAVWTVGTLPDDLVVPAGLANVVSISAGLHYCLAAKSDGTVVGWGAPGRPGSLVPAGLTDVVSVHAGSEVAAALKSDGTVVAWGTSGSAPPAGLSGVVAIAVGESHFYALKNDGRAVFWGGVSRWGLTWPTTDFANVQFVASAEYNIVGIGNAAGAAAPAITSHPTTLAPGLGETITFSVAATGTAPLTYQWQRRAPGTADFVEVPYLPAVYSGARTPTLTVTGTTAKMRGDEFRCVVSNGIFPSAISGIATLNVTAAPVFTSAAHGTFSALQPGTFTVAATGAPAPTFTVASGNFPAWATLDATTGQITGTPPSTAGSPFAFTIEARNDDEAPATVQEFVLTVVIAPNFTFISPPRQTVVSGRTLSIAGTATGATAYQWKRNGRPLAGATSATLTLTAAKSYRDAGWYQLVATNAAGASTVSPVVFVNVVAAPPQFIRAGNFPGTSPPTDLTGVALITGGGALTLALKSDGRAVAWGWGRPGTLDVPDDLVDVVALASNGDDSAALRSDGSVVTWGNPISLVHNVPAGLSRVVQVAVGGGHALALRDDGSVVGWGNDYYGQSTAPTGLRDVVAVAAGNYHSLALKSDGTVVSWGGSYAGQLNAPAGLADVVALSSFYDHNLALRADGTLVEWGSRPWSGGPPVLTPGAVAIVTSYSTNLALKSDGTVVGWGSASYGELTFPAGTDQIVGLAIGSSGSTLLRDGTVNLAPAITTPPASQTKDPGQSASFTVVATGTAPLVYQWQRQAAGTTVFADLVPSSVYGGVATATLTVAGTTAAMSDDRFRCVVSNGIGTPATSAAAELRVVASPAFTSTASAPFFINRSVSITVTASGTPAPTFSASGLPVWATLDATTGVLSGTAPDATGAPFTVTLTASNGIGSVATQTFTLHVRLAHSADVSPADGTISLVELTRVIELYNTRAGTVRTGRYVAATGTIDGFAPDPSVTAGPMPTAPHTADLNRDGRLSITELTRVIELYGTRSGPTRTGQYRSQASTEDGFAPGL